MAQHISEVINTPERFIGYLETVMKARDNETDKECRDNIAGYLRGLIRGYEMATGKKVAFNPIAEDGENPFSIIDKEERR